LLRDELWLVTLPHHADDPARREQGQSGATTPVGDAGGLAGALRLPVLALEGGWEEARRIAEVSLADADPALRAALSGIAGPLARAQGDTARAWDLVRAVLPGGPATAPGAAAAAFALPVQRLAAALALDAGDLPAAQDWLLAHECWLASTGMVLERSEGQALRARYHRAAGDLDRAHDWARRALASAEAPRRPLALLEAHRLLGELATAAGRHAEAREQFDAALALADACGAPYERALTLLARAELHLAAGARAAGDADLAAARALCAPRGARPALARADALAARSAGGARRLPSPRRQSRPAGLTLREAEVLRLMARGLTNAQVADQFFLSPRTISHHLASAYGRLGVNSRAEATHLALEHGLS
jgi:DNA-binding CsgD family transcriptional regulator